MTSLSESRIDNEVKDTIFPVSAEHLDEINNVLLGETIFADAQTKVSRAAQYERVIQDRVQKIGIKTVFQVSHNESPFSAYSSKGWKIHLPFEKGQEHLVGMYLFGNGLYFKVEAGVGTYFNGNLESGATVYIGSYDAMQAVTDAIKPLAPIITDGTIARYADGSILHMGSGSDIEIDDKITARFDVIKTEHGLANGSGKYNEDGLASWTRLGGIPLLSADVVPARNIENRWGQLSPDDKIDGATSLRHFYENAKHELMKDFGEEFVFGNKD